MQMDNKTDSKKIDKKVGNLAKSKESKIEKELVKVLESRNGVCMKFVSPGKKGVPDRLCLLPDSRLFFVELKKPGKRINYLQEYSHRVLSQLGFEVRVISNFEQLKQFRDEIQAL